MGSFASSKPVSIPEEVVVHTPHLAVAPAKQATASSSSRDEAGVEPSSQADSNRVRSGSFNHVPAREDSQPSQASRQKAASSSLHVNSRIASEAMANELDRAPEMALAEEEEMRIAIEASLREERNKHSGAESLAAVGHSLTAQMRTSSGEDHSRLAFDAGYRVRDDTLTSADPGVKQIDTRERPHAAYPSSKGFGRGHQPADAVKAAGIGLGKDYAWVDNSDFQSPRMNQETADRTADTRSASCGSRSRSSGARSGAGPSGRSGIVSLPRIPQHLPIDQQAMVKDLHEKIKETISPHENEEHSRASHGALGRSAAADVRRVMEDLCTDELLGRPRGVSGERELPSEQFNERFHSLAQRDPRGGIDRAMRYESPFQSRQRYESPLQSRQRERGPTI